MSPMSPDELTEVRALHAKWLRSEDGGVRANLAHANLAHADLAHADLAGAILDRANLAYANLTYAILARADLAHADLAHANLTYANLAHANLASADLAGANLAHANLARANLAEIRDDLFAVLSAAPGEVAGLYRAIVDGRVNGKVYEGECACLVGTIANVRGCRYDSVPGLHPNADRAAERWFLAIGQGATPDSSSIVAITRDWIVEWAETAGVQLPTRVVTWENGK